jgi:hypothetical protein
MKKILPLLLLICLLAGCNKKQVSIISKDYSVKTIVVNPEKTIGKSFYDIIKNPVFIQLETNENCLLQGVSKVQIYKNKIYIFELGIAGGQILCFNLQGKYQFTVGMRGQGPGEYIFLTDMYVDEESECIWLGDNYKKILKYDLNGHFIEQFSTEFSLMNLISVQKNVMAIRVSSYKDKNYSFIIYSLNNKKVLYYKNATNTIDAVINKNSFSNFNKEIMYVSGISDTIFTVEKSELIPKYIIDFGKNRIEESLLNSVHHRHFIVDFMKPENKYAGNIKNCHETDDYVFFNYSFAGKTQLFCYSKLDDRAENISEIEFNGKRFNPTSFFKSKTDLGYVSVLSSHAITENEKEDDQRQQFGSYKNFDELLLNLRADDNPVLVLGDVEL